LASMLTPRSVGRWSIGCNAAGLGALGEHSLALTEDHRGGQEPLFVDQVVLHQRLRTAAATQPLEFATALAFEFGDSPVAAWVPKPADEREVEDCDVVLNHLVRDELAPAAGIATPPTSPRSPRRRSCAGA
jgi:hypothetical protein